MYSPHRYRILNSLRRLTSRCIYACFGIRVDLSQSANSSSDFRVLLPLCRHGEACSVKTAHVTWPRGSEQDVMIGIWVHADVIRCVCKGMCVCVWIYTICVRECVTSHVYVYVHVNVYLYANGHGYRQLLCLLLSLPLTALPCRVVSSTLWGCKVIMKYFDTFVLTSWYINVFY